MRFGWAQSEPDLPKWPAAAETTFETTANNGWTHGLENDDSYNGFLDSFLLPARGEEATTITVAAGNVSGFQRVGCAPQCGRAKDEPGALVPRAAEGKGRNHRASCATA